MIKGEYWINDGSVDYADGDVGDYNHEYIAQAHVINQYAENIIDLADELKLDYEINQYDHNPEEISNVLSQIYNHLEDETDHHPDGYISNHIGANQETMRILFGRGDARFYVQKFEGWIAVRGMNIELFGYNEQKRKSLINGLNEIFHQEGIDDDIPAEEIEFSLYDHKTNRSTNLTLADIENKNIFRPQQLPTSKGHNKFQITSPDKTENIPNNNKSVPNKTNLAAQKAGITTGQLWRGTSESIDFKSWFLNSTKR